MKRCFRDTAYKNATVQFWAWHFVVVFGLFSAALYMGYCQKNTEPGLAELYLKSPFVTRAATQM